MIAIIDYSMGNLCSVTNALHALGQDVCITASEKDLQAASHIILPGVGAFPDAIARLNETGLIGAMKEQIAKGKPFLGICLGMQLLYEGSDEFGYREGLGLFQGKITLMKVEDKVPHMGWNQVRAQKDSPIFHGIENEYFYFVHSFWRTYEEGNPEAAGITEYCRPFISACGKGNLFGVQFHPEKSGRAGLKLLKNFIDLKS